MRRFRALYLFILLISCVGAVKAQTNTRTLVWPETPMDSYKLSDDSDGDVQPFLHLNANAAYPLMPLMVPFYAEVIPVSTGGAISVQFSQMVYRTLAAQELKLLSKEELEALSDLKPQFVVGTARGQQMVDISVPALRTNPSTGEVEKLISFNFTLQPGVASTKKMSATLYASNSVLANGDWRMIKVSKRGIYKLTYDELVAMGFSDVKNISLWGHDGNQLSSYNDGTAIDDLKQIPVWMSNSSASFGKGDYILFYVNGPVSWELLEGDSIISHSIHDYSSYSGYFLTTRFTNPLRISSAPVPPGTHTRISSSYDALYYVEQNDVNLIKTGREWLGENFDLSSSRTYTLPFSDPVSDGKASIRIRVAARSSVSSSFSVKAKNSTLGSISIGSVNLANQYGNYTAKSTKTFITSYNQGNLTLELTYNKPTPSARAWLDFITVNARQQLVMRSDQLQFRDIKSVGAGNITRFDIANAQADLMVWDVTDFFSEHKNVAYSLQGSVAQAKVATSELKELIAFYHTQAYKVGEVVTVTNQNIHGSGQPNMVIVTHPDYFAQSNTLAQLHRDYSGLSVDVYTSQEVYNEFSSGTPDVSAIRNMMRMFYKRANGDAELPRYLLLMGDGSYDNRSTASDNTNRILTFQSLESNSPVSSFVTDDYFGLLDDGEGEGVGLLDIGVGRIPCNTVTEANIVISKIKEYMFGKHGSWHNQISFIGDDGDGNQYMEQADELATYIESNYTYYNVERILFDAYPMEVTSEGARYPDVTEAINSRANQGALLMNYVGHANTRWLAHEKVLMISDILQWRNFDRLPLFVTATCEFSRFDDPERKSAGEHTLFASQGGSIALFSTTRVVYSTPNHNLVKNFFKNAFAQRPDYVEGQNDRYYRLGDLIRLAKVATSGHVNKRNFMLLGDPALMLHYPDNEMGVTAINGKLIATDLDTLKALSRVEIKGEVIQKSGKDGFVGEAELTLFDKTKEVTTLSNKGGNPFVFTTRESTVYKGRSSIVDNQFSAQFIIPKDIMYEYGGGRISLFASDGSNTGAGYFEDFIIGGMADSIGNDSDGPQIEIYMNNEKFVPGGYTDPNPKLIVVLADSSGINTTGAGIGHDLTATITGAEEHTIILNDFYVADLDDFTKGRATYQLADLKEGKYEISVKAWDVYNNSSETKVDFAVQSDEQLKLSHVLNYPNPFTSTTGFYFEHNQPFSDFDVIIQIFSPSGKLVKTIEQYLPTDGGYRVGPIFWDGLDDYADAIGRGVYFYRLRVKPSEGKAVEVYQKLVILK